MSSFDQRKQHVQFQKNYIYQNGFVRPEPKLETVEYSLIQGDFVSALQEIDSFTVSARRNMPLQQQAKLRYFEALVHLRGKRPYTLSLDNMSTVEGFMKMASSACRIYSYKCILAVLKRDFTGLAKQEADQLMREARRLLPLKSEDRDNITLFSKVLPSLYQEYTHVLFPSR